MRTLISINEKIDRSEEIVFGAMGEMMEVLETIGIVTNVSSSKKINFYSCSLVLDNILDEHSSSTTMIQLKSDASGKRTIINTVTKIESLCTGILPYLRHKLYYLPLTRATLKNYLGDFKRRVHKWL